MTKITTAHAQGQHVRAIFLLQPLRNKPNQGLIEGSNHLKQARKRGYVNFVHWNDESSSDCFKVRDGKACLLRAKTCAESREVVVGVEEGNSEGPYSLNEVCLGLEKKSNQP